jgi:hypothetical protein
LAVSEDNPSLPDWLHRAGDPGARRRRRLATRLRDSARLVLGTLVVGVLLGAGARLLLSLAVDSSGLVIVALVAAALGILIWAVWHIASNGLDPAEIGLLAVALVAGFAGGHAVGPTVAAPVTVEGSYSLDLVTPMTLHLSGRLDCTWAAGHGRLERVVPRDDIVLGGAPPHRLAVVLIGRRIELTAPGSRLLAFGDRFAAPEGTPTWGPGDRSGTVVLDLVQVLVPEDERMPSEATGTFSWDCPGPEAATPAGLSDPARGTARSATGG